MTNVLLIGCRRVGTGLILLALAAHCASAAAPKRVLILDSFGRDVAPFNVGVSALRTKLARELGQAVDIYEAPLDTARFAAPGFEKPLADFLQQRFAGSPIDLVIPVAAPAVTFATQHRDELFANTPILFVGADPRRLPSTALKTNATLVTQKVDLPGMIEDMLQIQPDTTNVVVIVGGSPLEKFWARECHREWQSFTNRVGFSWLETLSLEQIQERVAKLPPHSFIVSAMLLMDADGVPYDGYEALEAIHAAANAPVFGFYRSHLGHGAIGGRLYQDALVGEEAAKVAIRILHGEKAGDIPPVILGSSDPTYDWRELTRWGIGADRLPAGSVIEFRESTFWEQHRWRIVGVGAFCCLQTALIAGLLVNRARRRKEHAVAALIAELSSRFINLPADKVDPEIENAQRRICECLGLDISMLWQGFADDPEDLVLTHVCRLVNGPPIAERMRAQEHFPWCLEEVKAKRRCALESLKTAPAGAARDLNMFRQLGIQANLTIPLAAGEWPVLGAAFFSSVRKERKWPEEVIARLEVMAQIFANALARKRSSEALRRREEQYRRLFEQMQSGVIVLEVIFDRSGNAVDHRLIQANAQFEVQTGLNRSEQLGKTSADLAWQWPEQVRQSYYQVALGAQPINCERFNESLQRYYDVRVFSPTRGQFAVLFHDITERKRADEALKASEQRFRTLAESSLVGIYVVQDGRYQYVNPAMAGIFGYSPAEITGMSPTQIVQPCDRAKVGDNIRRRIAGEVKSMRYEFRGRHKDGSTRQVEVYGTRLEGNGTPALVGTLLDITERKLAETALRESEQRFKQVAEIAGEFIWEVDAEGLYTYASPLVEEILGYCPEELVGKKHFYDLFDPSVREELKGAALRVFADRQTFRNFPNLNVSKSGKVVLLETSGVPIVDAAGKLAGYRGADTDVTARRQAEAEAQHSRLELAHVSRVSTLGELAASLAHELSQPLGAILRNAEAAEIMLKAASPDLEELSAIIADIRNDDRRATLVIDRLRSLLKRQGLVLQPIDINTVIAEVMLIVQADALARHVKLKHFITRDLPRVRGDRVHLQQVLLNLFLNGMDALGGVSVGNRNIHITAQRTSSGAVEVQVCDSGPGIPDDTLERLFEPFYTTKQNGMGMGLPVSKTIIEAHHGTIRAENRPEGGACFCFALPQAHDVSSVP